MANSDSENESEVDDHQAEAAERAELIRQITAYHREFPEILTKRSAKTSTDARRTVAAHYTTATPIEKLREDLAEVKKQVTSKAGATDMAGLIFPLALTFQALGSLLGLKLDGPKKDLATSVRENREALTQITKELMCKYDMEGKGACEPEVRLLLSLGTFVYLTHAENTAELEEQKRQKDYAQGLSIQSSSSTDSTDSQPPSQPPQPHQRYAE
jgi:hypothetical protein